MQRYVGLVRAYVLDTNESHLAAIGALRDALVAKDAPIEDLVGMHERAMMSLKDLVTPDNFEEVIAKTSTCLTELVIAYSLADQKKKDVLENVARIDRERQRLEALGQMAGGVAHEFNNLLQPILGMAELALDDAAPGSELAEQLAMIVDCAGQAAVIARGILTTARKQGPPAQDLPFAPLLKKAVLFLSAILPDDVTLDLSIRCGDERVLCEEGELAQVLLNLVRNGADAMNGKGTIRITLLREDGMSESAGESALVPTLRLTIADQGAGMPADVAARAFQPFFTTKPPTQGTGLGLSIVMSIVDGWRGDVRIETAPGEGTAVSIILPVA